MQLPRGRFDRFIRDETVSGIIRELGETGYSGSCSGIFGESAAELIFENGRVILAESSGNKSVDTLSDLHSNPGGKVAAELSVYNQAQLKLAREFNPKCVVHKEAFDSLFSDQLVKEKPAGESSVKIMDKESGPETIEGTPEKDKGDEIGLDDSDIDLIVTNFRSGAKDILKKINLDHLMVESKSGEDDND